jgi:hypothetical protein
LPNVSLDLDVDWELETGECYRGRIVVFHRKDGRNRDMFVYLQTNLPRTDFPARCVSDLYRLRWQVELFFKECKSHANLHAFDTGKAEIAEGLIWASLLCAVVKRGLTHRAEAIAGTSLSTARAAGAAKHYLDAIMDAFANGVQHIAARMLAALRFLALHAARAHPARDRRKGRLATGLRHVAVRADGGSAFVPA